MSAEPTRRPDQPLPIVISIQSQVAWGHVGNSAAAWPMRACGVEVIEVPTALLSNHPHYPSMRGRLLDPDLVDEILSGLAERGIHQRATAILSGFMGQAGTASVVAAFVRQAKDTNPDLLYACDPVMGDADLGFFRRCDAAQNFRRRPRPAGRFDPAERVRTGSAFRHRHRRPRCRCGRPRRSLHACCSRDIGAGGWSDQ